METIPHRELRNNSSKVLARVKAGETIAVSNHGEIAAVLVPPGTTEYDQMISAGLITPAASPGNARGIRRSQSPLSSDEVLDDLRDDR